MIKTLYSTLCKCERKRCNASPTCIPMLECNSWCDTRTQEQVLSKSLYYSPYNMEAHFVPLCLYILQLSRARNFFFFFVNSHTFTNYFLSFTWLPYYTVHKYNILSSGYVKVDWQFKKKVCHSLIAGYMNNWEYSMKLNIQIQYRLKLHTRAYLFHCNMMSVLEYLQAEYHSRRRWAFCLVWGCLALAGLSNDFGSMASAM